jgi:hypothetical protein
VSNLPSITTEGAEALAASTAETVLQVRGVTTQKVEIAEVTISCDQQPTTEVENVAYRLLYQTTDGTATGATEIPGDPGDPAPALTGFHSFSAEPTAGGIIREGYFPANGEKTFYWAEGDGPKVDDATSSRIGVELTASAVVNARASISWRILAA